jgi:hypothetical protein
MVLHSFKTIVQKVTYNSVMFFKHYQRVTSHIIMMVMLFASFAPTVSHALVLFTGNQSFTQQICNSNGDTVIIQVKTTMGKQLATELPLTTTQNVDSFEQHFEHCPFCTNLYAQATLPSIHLPILAKLEGQAHRIARSTTPDFVSYFSLPPPSQAPPKSFKN